MRRLLQLVARDGDHQPFLEYVLVAGLISVVAIVAAIKMSQGITLVYSDLGHLVTTLPAGY